MNYRSLLVSWISLAMLAGCSTMRVPSLNMLTERAEYEGDRRLESTLKEALDPQDVPKRTGPRLADIWIHPHEMATGDYFRGGWVRTIVSDSQWKVGDPPSLEGR